VDKWDWYIGLGFALLVLGIASIAQQAGQGYTFLGYVAALVGVAFMGYGAAKSLGSRYGHTNERNSPTTPFQTPVSITSQGGQSGKSLFFKTQGVLKRPPAEVVVGSLLLACPR
jgi:hypothetical protein